MKRPERRSVCYCRTTRRLTGMVFVASTNDIDPLTANFAVVSPELADRAYRRPGQRDTSAWIKNMIKVFARCQRA